MSSQQDKEAPSKMEIDGGKKGEEKKEEAVAPPVVEKKQPAKTPRQLALEGI